MPVPCVRVPRERGEETRRELADRGLLDADHEIVATDGDLLIPVVDPDAISDEYSVERRFLPERETQTTPAALLGFDPSYERLGTIAILHEDDPDRARRIARAIADSDLPVTTVVNRASKVKGDRRVRDWEPLVGTETETVHREYGYEYLLDIETVYFSPRLATERRRVTTQVERGEHVLDMFAGVGPFVIPAADRGAMAVGVDINEHAIAYLRENARRNDVADRVTAIHGDVRDLPADYDGWADRLVMNLPHSAEAFLPTAMWLAGDVCHLHYYDIQHEDDPFGPGERAIREAAEDRYSIAIEATRDVRSYAPHERNVCLDVRLTRRNVTSG